MFCNKPISDKMTYSCDTDFIREISLMSRYESFRTKKGKIPSNNDPTKPILNMSHSCLTHTLLCTYIRGASELAKLFLFQMSKIKPSSNE